MYRNSISNIFIRFGIITMLSSFIFGHNSTCQIIFLLECNADMAVINSLSISEEYTSNTNASVTKIKKESIEFFSWPLSTLAHVTIFGFNFCCAVMNKFFWFGYFSQVPVHIKNTHPFIFSYLFRVLQSTFIYYWQGDFIFFCFFHLFFWVFWMTFVLFPTISSYLRNVPFPTGFISFTFSLFDWTQNIKISSNGGFRINGWIRDSSDSW